MIHTKEIDLNQQKYDDDTTKKKNIEILFRESEKRRLMALEATSDGVWDWNIVTGQIITSPSYFTMLGYTLSELDVSYPEFVTSYDEFINILHVDDRENVENRLHDYIISKKTTCELELRMKTKSGGWKWILKRGKTVEWDDEGNPIRMIGTHIDINESRLAKDELRKSQERIRAQYMGTPIPTYTWQKVANGIILVDYNPSAYEFTNGKISGFIGKEAHILYKENMEIYEKILKTYNNRNNCKFETLYHMFSTDDTKYITFTCAYIAPDMVLVHMEDITKQKIAEKEIQASAKNVRDLTVQLFKAEENVRKYIAQELHDSIGQYLSSIKYIAEETINQIHTGNYEKGCLSLETSISLIQTMIDEVSRISMGLHPSTLDDLGIIATISWFCREYHCIYPNIDLEKKIEVEESDIHCSIKIPLFRILQESLNNVACHSQATKVKVSLSKKGSRIEMSIIDNGIGFDVQEKILADHDNRRGFGLVSMRERTKYSGGVFCVDSAREKGTEIQVSWPCK